MQFVNLLFSALQLMVFVYVLGSWFPGVRRSPIFRAISDVVDPMCEPFRRILPPQSLGGLDISPVFVILVLGFLHGLVGKLFAPQMPVPY